MTIDTIAVTGGTGDIGSAIIDHLNDCGYRTVNLDRRRGDDKSADVFQRVDLLDAGKVYGSLAGCDVDAVIHMGTISNLDEDPGHVVYEGNVMTSYHVLEAVMELELEALCLASSIHAIGRSTEGTPPEVTSLPVDETHPTRPRNAYELGKRAIEITADGFGRRPEPPRTISTLRFPDVKLDGQVRSMSDDDRSLSALREQYSPQDDPLFSYIHVEDAARIARRTIEADFDGHETFWAVAADTTAAVPTTTLIDTFYPDLEVSTVPSGYEGLISIEKAQEMLDWEPAHSWRDW